MQLFTSPWKPRTVLPPVRGGSAVCVPETPGHTQFSASDAVHGKAPGCLSSPTAATAPQMLTARALGADQERAGPQDSARLAVKVCVTTTRGS